MLGAGSKSHSVLILSGASTGIAEGLVIVPFELVKVRLQDHKSAVKSVGALQYVRNFISEEGILGLYKGTGPVLWRGILFNVGYFGVIDKVRSLFSKPRKTKLEKLRNNFLAGSMGGIVGVLLSTPFDVVKSRVQSKRQGNEVEYGYKKTLPSLLQISKTEGVRGLYKGLTPKALRLGFGGGIMLVIYDIMLQVFEKGPIMVLPSSNSFPGMADIT